MVDHSDKKTKKKSLNGDESPRVPRNQRLNHDNYEVLRGVH